MPALDTAFASAVNRLLREEPGAHAQLIPHAGKVVEISAAGLPALRFAIGDEGTLAAAALDARPAVSIRLTGQALSALAEDGGLPGERFVAALDASGDRELADVLRLLAKYLRWDAEGALARIFGDVAARRIADTGRSVLAWQAQSAGRVAQTFWAWIAEEKQLLVGRAEYADFSRSLQELSAAIERLNERLR